MKMICLCCRAASTHVSDVTERSELLGWAGRVVRGAGQLVDGQDGAGPAILTARAEVRQRWVLGAAGQEQVTS